MKKILRFLVALACFNFSSSLSAHHGFTAHFYPDQILRIEGTVKQFDFVNPHGYLYIESLGEDGSPVVYVCDLQARSQLLRRGADETLFTVGESIVVEGFKARRNPLQCEFGVAYFEDGSTFTMRTLDRGQTQFAENNETSAAKEGAQSIIGKWMRPGMYFAEVSGSAPIVGADSITTEGQLARDNFDPITGNPVLRCKGGSPARNWGAPGLATEIYEKDGNIYIYHESMDITRTIYMDESEVPAEVEPSDMGLSVGRFENNELIIASKNFSAGVLRGSVLNSDEMTMVERLSITENGRLLISWTATDPLYYSEPILSSQILQSTAKEIIPYECVPELH